MGRRQNRRTAWLTGNWPGTELSREMSEAFRELKGAGCPAFDLLQAAQADVLPPSLGDPVRRHL